MKILFVDHACHQKTKSADFFLGVLRTRHEVRCHYYDHIYRCKVSKDLIEWADVIVYWEFLPSRFACGVPGKRCVFVPMYDNEWGSKWQWRRLAMLGMNVISFCRTVGDHARHCGVKNVLNVRYAFDPSKYEGMSGDPRIALYWDRGAFDVEKVKEMFAPGTLDKLIVYDKFVPRDEYLKMIREVGVYVAPRFKEGIGMSFLEPLAMGKCIIAHDGPTMNEYIQGGTDGILVDMRHPRQISAAEISAAREGVRTAANDLHAGWRKDEQCILAFFNGLSARPSLRSPWMVGSMVSYLLYWLEGILMRIAEMVRLC